ncbi:Versicolorin reductase [Lachnellula subtilissima]|uniref:Versicolorin reductase n=1 Tax=Lachnellula subtilissima TaxID=602034 RepID=A0A8H8UCC7_9HELO|nr:Versicolorin reductase [Lachnellula subtilissima]
MSTSSLPLAGKVALVTGGSKGIGRATSLRLARDGAKVVVNYASSSKDADEVVNLIGSEQAIAIKADVGNVEQIGKLIDATVAKWGKIDILIACAGLMRLNELEKLTEAEFDTTFNLNVKGPMFLTQKAVPHMSSGSRVVLFSTTQCHASTVTPNYLAYIASKGAIEQMTRGLSKDLARKGIMVNCCAPGPTATDLFLNGKSEQLLKMIAGFNPQNKIGMPEEVAEVVAFLSSPAASWVSGQVLKTNGGQA